MAVKQGNKGREGGGHRKGGKEREDDGREEGKQEWKEAGKEGEHCRKVYGRQEGGCRYKSADRRKLSTMAGRLEKQRRR